MLKGDTALSETLSASFTGQKHPGRGQILHFPQFPLFRQAGAFKEWQKTRHTTRPKSRAGGSGSSLLLSPVHLAPHPRRDTHTQGHATHTQPDPHAPQGHTHRAGWPCMWCCCRGPAPLHSSPAPPSRLLSSGRLLRSFSRLRSRFRHVNFVTFTLFSLVSLPIQGHSLHMFCISFILFPLAP